MGGQLPLLKSEKIEQYKENFTVPANGRTISVLKRTIANAKLASADPATLKLRLRKCERHFFNHIEEHLEADDPLKAFVDHIDALDEIYPQGTSTQQKRALECCARRFMHDSRYKQDERLVNMWVRYAGLASDPILVFKYMAQLSIGTSRASFYISYAELLEERSLWRQALAVYERGNAVKAQPLEHLEHATSRFKARYPTENAFNLGPTQNRQAPLPSTIAPSSAQPNRVAQSNTEHGQSQIEVYQDSGNSSCADEEEVEVQAFLDPNVNPGVLPPLTRILNENQTQPSSESQLLQPPVQTAKRKFDVYQSPRRSCSTAVVTPVQPEKLYVAIDFILRKNKAGEVEELSLDEIMLQARRLNDLKFPRRPPPEAAENEGSWDNGVVDRLYLSEPTKTLSDAQNLLADATFSSSLDEMQIYDPPTMTFDRRNPNRASIAISGPKRHTINEKVTLELQSQRTSSYFGGRADGLLGKAMPSFDSQHSRGHTVPKPMPITPLSVHQPPAQELSMQSVVFDQLAEIFPSEPPHSDHALPEVLDPAAPNLRELFRPIILRCLQLDVNFVYTLRKFGCLNQLKAATQPTTLTLTNVKFKLRKKIASGGYGTVWPCINEKTGHLYALKGEEASVPWELYSLKMARARIKCRRTLESITRVYYSECFSDEQYHLMPLLKYDTILSVARAVKTREDSEKSVERLAAFFAIELLRVVEQLHANHIIHGDLKAENVMLRAPDVVRSALPGRNFLADGSQHWAEYGIVLIDFGRAIDLKLFPEHQKFKAGWNAQEYDSWEIKQNLPWTYEIDYHGLAEVIHVLLFQDRMMLDTSGPRRKLRRSYKRTWNVDLWTSFFDILLNAYGRPLPLCDQLSDLRSLLENWLVNNSDGLQTLLVSILSELRRKAR